MNRKQKKQKFINRKNKLRIEPECCIKLHDCVIEKIHTYHLFMFTEEGCSNWCDFMFTRDGILYTVTLNTATASAYYALEEMYFDGVLDPNFIPKTYTLGVNALIANEKSGYKKHKIIASIEDDIISKETISKFLNSYFSNSLITSIKTIDIQESLLAWCTDYLIQQQ